MTSTVISGVLIHNLRLLYGPFRERKEGRPATFTGVKRSINSRPIVPAVWNS